MSEKNLKTELERCILEQRRAEQAFALCSPGSPFYDSKQEEMNRARAATAAASMAAFEKKEAEATPEVPLEKCLEAERERARWHDATPGSTEWNALRDARALTDFAVRSMSSRLEELEKLFDLIWAADQRATALWIAEKPQERALIAPDRTNMVKWLLDKLDTVESKLKDAEHALGLTSDYLHEERALEKRLEKIERKLRELDREAMWHRPLK